MNSATLALKGDVSKSKKLHAVGIETGTPLAAHILLSPKLSPKSIGAPTKVKLNISPLILAKLAE